MQWLSSTTNSIWLNRLTTCSRWYRAGRELEGKNKEAPDTAHCFWKVHHEVGRNGWTTMAEIQKQSQPNPFPRRTFGMPPSNHHMNEDSCRQTKSHLLFLIKLHYLNIVFNCQTLYSFSVTNVYLIEWISHREIQQWTTSSRSVEQDV